MISIPAVGTLVKCRWDDPFSMTDGNWEDWDGYDDPRWQDLLKERTEVSTVGWIMAKSDTRFIVAASQSFSESGKSASYCHAVSISVASVLDLVELVEVQS